MGVDDGENRTRIFSDLRYMNYINSQSYHTLNHWQSNKKKMGGTVCGLGSAIYNYTVAGLGILDTSYTVCGLGIVDKSYTVAGLGAKGE